MKKCANKKADELFNLTKIFREAKNGINSVDAAEDEFGTKETYVSDVVSGAAGQHMFKEMADIIGFDIKKDEDPIDCIFDIEHEFDKMADEINTKKPNDLPGMFYFGYLDADGSYGLFYSEDKEDEPKTTAKKITRLIKQ